MDFINLAKYEYLKLEDAVLKIKEVAAAEYFNFMALLQNDPTCANQTELIFILRSLIIRGNKEKEFSYAELEKIINVFEKVNNPSGCIIVKNNKNIEFTKNEYLDGVFTRIADFIADDYKISPIEVFNTFSLRQILIYYAIIYNRKIQNLSGKNKDKPEAIIIPKMAQEVSTLPRKYKLEYYANKMKEMEASQNG